MSSADAQELLRRCRLILAQGRDAVAPSLFKSELQPILQRLRGRYGATTEQQRRRKRKRVLSGPVAVAAPAAAAPPPPQPLTTTTRAPTPTPAVIEKVPFSCSQRWKRQRTFYETQGVGAWHGFHVPFRISSNSLCAAQIGKLALAFWEDSAAAEGIAAAELLTVVELGDPLARADAVRERGHLAQHRQPLARGEAVVISEKL